MPDTTQQIVIDTYDQSGAASITFTLLDSTVDRDAVSVDTIDHEFSAGSNNTIIVTLTNATVIPAGDYMLQVTIDGVAGFVWVAIAGVDGEVVEATAEREKLTAARLGKIDGAMQAGAGGVTGKTLSDQIDAIGSTLAGPYTREITITDADTSVAIESALVRLSKTGATETKLTNSSGIAEFTTEAATWSYAVTANGYGGESGTIVISDDGSTAIELTANSVSVPTNPSMSALNVLCLDEAGDPESGVDVDIRIVTVPSGDTNIAYKGTKQTATSGVDGIASLEAVKGAEYEYKRGAADIWQRVTIGVGSATNVSSFIGAP